MKKIKYKLYFHKPELTSPPAGKWEHWLPDTIRNNIKIVSTILSFIALAVVVFLFIFFNANGELTMWLRPLVDPLISRFNDNFALRLVLSAVIIVPIVIIMVLTHEILHLVITISKGDIYIYRNPELNGISPFSDCELSFWQSVTYKLLPVVVMSGGFGVLGFVAGGYVGSFLLFIAALNLAGSMGDLLLTPFMFRLPRNAVFYDDWWQVRG